MRLRSNRSFVAKGLKVLGATLFATSTFAIASTPAEASTLCLSDGMGNFFVTDVTRDANGNILTSRVVGGPCNPSTFNPNTFTGSSSSSSMMNFVKHTAAGSLIRPGTRVSDRLTVSGLAFENPVVQAGQRREEDDDDSDVSSGLSNTFGGGTNAQTSSSNFPGGSPGQALFFDRARFDGFTVDTSYRHVEIDNPFSTITVADYQFDVFATQSFGPRFQAQAGIVNTYSEIDVTGGANLSVYRAEVYGGVFVGILPWLWYDGSVGAGIAHFDGNAAAAIADETAELLSANSGVSVVLGQPGVPWAATARVGVNHLYVGTNPDTVSQTKLDLNARVGRTHGLGPGGGAIYGGVVADYALANPANPNENWNTRVEAGAIFAIPNAGVLRLSGDALVNHDNVENYAVKLTFHLFPRGR